MTSPPARLRIAPEPPPSIAGLSGAPRARFHHRLIHTFNDSTAYGGAIVVPTVTSLSNISEGSMGIPEPWSVTVFSGRQHALAAQMPDSHRDPSHRLRIIMRYEQKCIHQPARQSAATREPPPHGHVCMSIFYITTSVREKQSCNWAYAAVETAAAVQHAVRKLALGRCSY